jgi:flagellar protein FlbD
MIELTKMNNETFYINPNVIEIIENTPDTLITTISGKKYYVADSVQEISNKFIEFYKKINYKP